MVLSRDDLVLSASGSSMARQYRPRDVTHSMFLALIAVPAPSRGSDQRYPACLASQPSRNLQGGNAPRPKDVEVLVQRRPFQERPWKYRTCAWESLEVDSSFELYLDTSRNCVGTGLTTLWCATLKKPARSLLIAAACSLNDCGLGCGRDPP